MSTKPRKTPIPSHLSARMRAWIDHVSTTYEIDEHHRLLLHHAAELHDRAEAARKIIAAEGIVVKSGGGLPKRHPAVQTEISSRLGFARLLRELGLDVESVEESRPREIRGRSYATGT